MQEQQEIILTQQSEIETLKMNSDLMEDQLSKMELELAEIKAMLEMKTVTPMITQSIADKE